MQQREVAIVCVSSKLEDATIPRPLAVKGKGKENLFGRGAMNVGLGNRMRAGGLVEGWERVSGWDVLRERERERERERRG